MIIDLAVIIIFFILIFIEITKIIKSNSNKEKSSKTNLRYITFFSLATLLPSILIAAFSLSLFYFALEKYLDKKVSIAVNNSYDMAKNYLEDIRNNIDADIVLISFDLNRNVQLFYDNKLEFNNLLRQQRLLRRVDEIHLINGSGKQIISNSINPNSEFVSPEAKALELVTTDERPLKIINALQTNQLLY